jgi:hypothetical protein
MSEVTRKEFDTLRKDFDTFKKSSKLGKAPKKTRKPSEFNLYVGDKIREIKAKNPDLQHKLAFSQAVESWNKQKKKKMLNA